MRNRDRRWSSQEDRYKKCIDTLKSDLDEERNVRLSLEARYQEQLDVEIELKRKLREATIASEAQNALFANPEPARKNIVVNLDADDDNETPPQNPVGSLWEKYFLEPGAA